jgi:quercetin dioxygenase-like cupin family protein
MNKPTPKLRVSAMVLLAAGLAGVLGYRAGSAQQPEVQRTQLLRVDAPGSATHEAIMSVVQLAAAAAVPRHRHPGVEIGYLLEGSVILEHEGRPAQALKPGDSFSNDGPHQARNTGSGPARILAVYLVEKGKPLAEPAP